MRRNLSPVVISIVLSTVVALLTLVPPPARAGGPADSCAGGIYEVRGNALLPNAVLPDALIIENNTVATASGCPPTTMVFELTDLGTALRAHWRDCGSGIRDVDLDALIGPYCERITGIVSSNGSLHSTEFYAALCEDGDACLLACRSNEECPASSLCERLPGSCRGPGLCRPIPPVCAEAARPVCGCNGTTYLNECDRRTAGVSLRDDGACTNGAAK